MPAPPTALVGSLLTKPSTLESRRPCGYMRTCLAEMESSRRLLVGLTSVSCASASSDTASSTKRESLRAYASITFSRGRFSALETRRMCPIRSSGATGFPGCFELVMATFGSTRYSHTVVVFARVVPSAEMMDPLWPWITRLKSYFGVAGFAFTRSRCRNTRRTATMPAKKPRPAAGNMKRSRSFQLVNFIAAPLSASRGARAARGCARRRATTARRTS